MSEPPTGIVILGGPEQLRLSKVWGQPVLGNASERLLAGIALAHRFPTAKIVVTGGTTNLLSRDDKGADIAAAVLISAGVSEDRIVVEDASRNTEENARFSKALVHPLGGEVWVLVTSASHMPRSVGIFCKLDWPVVPYPVDYRATRSGWDVRWDLASHLVDLNSAVREWIGLVAYRITGKTDTFFPQGC